MISRERVNKAIRCESTDRVPWVPFVGVHAGALLGSSAEDYLKSEDRIVSGIQRSIERYKPDGVPIAFDLQLEAEIFGCDLRWAHDNPPSVTSHPIASDGGRTLADLHIPQPSDGRLPIVLGAARRIRQANPHIALYGLITGPFTLVLHLMGTDVFRKMFSNPAEVKRAVSFGRSVCEAMAAYYIDAGCDVVAVVDPMTSQIGPEHFREFVKPFISPVFDSIRQRGALSSFFVCGHAQQNIQAMCECRPDNVSVDENISLAYVREQCLERGISFGGNLQLTTVLLLGKPQDAQRNAIECLQIGGERGFLLAPGCDLPYATPPENLEAIARIVLDPYERDVVRVMARSEGDEDILDMREYGQTDKVIVDIITLDSEACAPCQYMVESVRKIAPEFEGIVEWREHKIKHRESLVFMTSLMVKNIPTICIDGQITFVSRIPAHEELVAAIQKRIYEKLRMKIRSRQAALVILGTDGEKCQAVRENAERAMAELGVKADISNPTDTETILSYGVLPAQTPAVVLIKHQLKSTRTIPEPAIIKEWLKEVM